MMIIVRDDIPPHVRRAREKREKEEYEDMRQSIGVPCPKCGTKNLQGPGCGYIGGEDRVAQNYYCHHCHSRYADVSEFRRVRDPETWEWRYETVRQYVAMEGEW